MVSIIAWDKVHFLIFWTTTHYPTKLGQLIDLSKGNIFLNLLNDMEDWNLSSRLFFDIATAPITQ